MSTLPTLPPAFMRHWINCPFEDVALHTQDQMHAYATAAVAQERERWMVTAQVVANQVEALPHDMRRYVTGLDALLALVEGPNA